jgi:GNAT superfamily N-acetyltransferase
MTTTTTAAPVAPSMVWDVGTVGGPHELEAILALQRENHASRVSAEQARAQGFVTAQHTLAILERMHALGPSIVARASDGQLAGYALMMAREARALVPVLEPMFDLLETLSWRGRPLSALRYYLMGQICVAAAFRGQGVFDALYRGHRAHYAERFDLIVTEVSTRNQRSLRAHARVGFEELHRFRDATDEWSIIGWDFG